MSETEDKKSVEEIIKELENLKEIGGDLLALEPKILEANNAKLSYWFYVNVRGVNYNAHRQIVINSNDPNLNYNIACEIVSWVPILERESLSKHFKLLVKSAIAIRAHGRVVMASQDPRLNYLFARNINYADVKAHGRVVIASQDPEYNYKFARYIESADIKAHGQAVIDSKDSKYNYYFARDIKGADVDAHWEAIKATSEEKMKQSFVDEVPGMVAKNIASSLDNMIKAQKK